MLNKKTFYISISILILLLLLSYNFYISNKQTAFLEEKRFSLLKSKIEYANYLQNLFKTPRLNCITKKKTDSIVFFCKNLDKNKFSKIERKIFNNYIDIKNFNIISDGKKVDLKLEINR